MSTAMTQQDLQKIVLQWQYDCLYRGQAQQQVWAGVYRDSASPPWCLLLVDDDAHNMAVLQPLLAGLKTEIRPATEAEVVDVLQHRQGIIWCFSEAMLAQCIVDHHADDASVLPIAQLVLGEVQSRLVFLPSIDVLTRSSAMKRKLWQYFLHLK